MRLVCTIIDKLIRRIGRQRAAIGSMNVLTDCFDLGPAETSQAFAGVEATMTGGDHDDARPADGVTDGSSVGR